MVSQILNKRIFSLLILALLFAPTWSKAQIDIPNKPRVATSVYDGADILSTSEEQHLTQKLIRYADTTSTQIVIATIPSIQGGSMDMLATDWAHKWGVGQSDKDNGLFILISEGDKRIEIKTGYGLEAYLTDATTKTIIDQIILPEFRKGQFYSGLNKGTTAIFQVLNGTFQGAPKSRGNNQGIPSRLIFLGIFFVFIIISIFSKKNKGGKNGGHRQGSGLLDILILSSLGSSMGGGSFGGGGGGFGGGGFGGGFGGGGFGGGGAGGGW